MTRRRFTIRGTIQDSHVGNRNFSKVRSFLSSLSSCLCTVHVPRPLLFTIPLYVSSLIPWLTTVSVTPRQTLSYESLPETPSHKLVSRIYLTPSLRKPINPVLLQYFIGFRPYPNSQTRLLIPLN